MNAIQIIFIIVAFALVKGLIINEANQTEFELPTFMPPNVSFRDVPSSCSGFTDCVEYVGDIIVNVVLGFVYLVLLIVELLRYIVVLTAFIAVNAFEGVDGAPTWLNILFITPITAGIALIAYRLIRSGEGDDS